MVTKNDMVEETRRGGRSRQWTAQLGVDVKDPAGVTEREVEAGVGPAPGRDWDGGREASEGRGWGRCELGRLVQGGFFFLFL